MVQPIKIEIAKKADLKEILFLQKECYLSEALLYNNYNIQPLTQTIDSIKEEYDNGTIFLKATINNMIVASVRGVINNDTAHIGKLIVHPNFQNKHIAQTLMNAIEQQLNTCKVYELFTGHRSEKNIYLYKKLGYTEYKTQAINDDLTLVYMNKIV